MKIKIQNADVQVLTVATVDPVVAQLDIRDHVVAPDVVPAQIANLDQDLTLVVKKWIEVTPSPDLNQDQDPTLTKSHQFIPDPILEKSQLTVLDQGPVHELQIVINLVSLLKKGQDHVLLVKKEVHPEADPEVNLEVKALPNQEVDHIQQIKHIF